MNHRLPTDNSGLGRSVCLARRWSNCGKGNDRNAIRKKSDRNTGSVFAWVALTQKTDGDW